MLLSWIRSADVLQTQAYMRANQFIKEQVINRKSAIESKTEQEFYRFNVNFFFYIMLITTANNRLILQFYLGFLKQICKESVNTLGKANHLLL